MTLNPYLESLITKASSEAKAANGTQFDQKIGGLDGWRHLVISLLANSGSLMTLTPYLEDVVSRAEDSDAENARQFDKDIGGVDGWRHLAVALLGQLTEAVAGAGGGSAMPRSYLAGMSLANNGTDANNDIDIAAGACRDDGNTADIVLAAALTKQLDAAWAVGTNQGGLDTGVKGSATTYHVFAIKRSDTGVVDVLFSLSATAPTMPANYDLKRRIGSILTDGSSNIRTFIQNGDDFEFLSPTDHGAQAITAATALYTTGVPDGIRVKARLVYGSIQQGMTVSVSTPGTSDLALGSTGNLATLNVANSTGARASGVIDVWTNTSRQVQMEGIASHSVSFFATRGWMDRRGRDD